MTTSSSSTTFPPKFRPGEFLDEAAAPRMYSGPKFGIELVHALLRQVDEHHVRILDVTVPAMNVQFEVPESDPDYPIYFELQGRRYHYTFTIWSDRFVIEVHSARTARDYEARSTMFPVTETQLRQALATAVEDCLGA